MKLPYRIVGPCWLIGSIALAGCAGSISDPSDLGLEDSESTDDLDMGDDDVASDDSSDLEAGGHGIIDDVKMPADQAPTSTRYIVKFKEAASTPLKMMNASQRKLLVDTNKLEITKRGGLVKSLLTRINAVAAELTPEQVAELQTGGTVEFIERDPIRTLIAPTASTAAVAPQAESVPYGITMVQANQLSDTGASAIKVCITDTGYNDAHPDLPKRAGGRVTGNNNNGQGDDTGNWYQPGEGHGSHVAGTLAAIGGNNTGVVGVLPGNKVGLHIVKVFDNSGSWKYGSDMIVAIEQCMAAGAKVISMSLGGPDNSEAERAAFDDASAAGVISIAAAGNAGNTSLSYPSSYDSVMSVAAIDSSKRLAPFSQRNAAVDIAAPGVNVNSTHLGSSYMSMSGTSMATPHVSGVAALVWANNPACNSAQVTQALYATAEDLGTAGRDNSYGHGLVRAKAASDYLANLGCGGDPDPDPDPDPGEDELSNGVAKTNLSGTAGAELRYFVRVPAGATNLVISTAGGTGDADLYVRSGSAPTTGSNDCKSEAGANSERCVFATPQAGTYYVLVRGYAAFTGASLTATYTLGAVCQSTTVAATGLPVAIPDANRTGISSTINLSTAGTIRTLRLKSSIKHTYRSDLVVTLVAPNGTEFVQSDRAGGSADDLTLDLNIPGAVGLPASGAWRLRVQDMASQDVGTLQSYSLTVDPVCN